MENEPEKTRDQNQDSGQQQPIGQQDQSQQNENSQQNEDIQQNEDSQRSQGGFVASQDLDSGEYLQQGGSPESGFAEQGRGASNDSSDIEGTSERLQNRESDIEGSSDNS